MRTLPDSWEKVQCSDGSIEDVIFIEGHKFYSYAHAVTYVRREFFSSKAEDLSPITARRMAEDYLSLISVFNQPLDTRA